MYKAKGLGETSKEMLMPLFLEPNLEKGLKDRVLVLIPIKVCPAFGAHCGVDDPSRWPRSCRMLSRRNKPHADLFVLFARSCP